MSVERDFAVFIESLGGEDLLRWLMKDDGIKNWSEITLYPIISYHPHLLKKPIVVGVGTLASDGQCSQILADEWDFEHLPEFQEYVNYLMEMGDYTSPLQALSDHNRAMILNEIDMIDSNERGLTAIMMEVIEGKRANGITDSISFIKDGFEFEHRGIDTFFTFLAEILDVSNHSPINFKDEIFSTTWQTKWA